MRALKRNYDKFDFLISDAIIKKETKKQITRGVLISNQEARKDPFVEVGINISRFVHSLRRELPEIVGFGTGLQREDFGEGQIGEISDEEAISKIRFFIFLQEDLADDQKKRTTTPSRGKIF